MEEVTESYVLLSPQTYPQGGFNCQSSLRFLNTHAWLRAGSQSCSQGLRWHILNRINVHQNISLNPLPWYLCGKQTCQDRTDEIKCQFCMQKATPTGSTQGFWISTRKIGECGAAVKSVTAKDKRGRKNKRTDRSVFTALCLFTVRQAKLAISFSVPPKAQDMKATLFFCKWP